MELKLEISQKIIDDVYVDKWIWKVIDESKNVLAKGEENSLLSCIDPGRTALKKYQRKHEKNSLNDMPSEGGL